MKTKRTSFVGERPIFSGSPAIVPGGFNLDRSAQKFSDGDIIPAGTLAIYDEQTRKVKIVKTAKVKSIDSDDSTKVTLVTSNYYEPVFSVGDKVLKAIAGTYASAPSISKIEKSNGEYVITLSAAITGLAVDDVIIEVVSSVGKEVITGVISVSTTTLMVAPGLDIVAGDKVMEYPLATGALIANAKSVTSYDPISGKLVISAAITDLEAGAKVAKVYADGTAAKTTSNVVAGEIGDANALTISEVTVGEFETSIDVTHDTLNYALYERRVLPIPASQRSGNVLKANSHVRLSNSF